MKAQASPPLWFGWNSREMESNDMCLDFSLWWEREKKPITPVLPANTPPPPHLHASPATPAKRESLH